MSKRRSLEQHDDIVQDSLEYIAQNGLSSHVWDELVPQNIQDTDDLSAEGSASHPNHHILDPELFGHSMKPVFSTLDLLNSLAIEGHPDLLDDKAYRTLIRYLNAEQRVIFDEILHWCQQQVKSKHTGIVPPPFCLFISGLYISLYLTTINSLFI